MDREEFNKLIAEEKKKDTTRDELFDAVNKDDLEKVKSVCEENESIVKGIINKIKFINGKHRSLLECAADDQIAKYLIEQGADLSAAVANAVQRKDLKAVKSICEKNKSIVQRILKEKPGPLEAATTDNNYDSEIVKYLVQQGADPNAVDHSKCLLLHLQIVKGHFKGARSLVENGANVNAKNQEESYYWHNGDANAFKGDTSLHFAIRVYNNNKAKPEKAKQALEFIKFLIEKGADLSAKNRCDRTPLDIANKRQDNQELISLLESCPQPIANDDARQQEIIRAQQTSVSNGNNNNTKPKVQQQPTGNTKHNDSKPLNLSSRELAVIGIAMVACALVLYFLAPLILGANVGLGAKLALGAAGAAVGGYLTSIAVNKCCSEQTSEAKPN